MVKTSFIFGENNKFLDESIVATGVVQPRGKSKPKVNHKQNIPPHIVEN